MPKISDGAVKARPFRAIERADLDALPQLAALPADRRLAMRAVAEVLPFRSNEYVVDHLIDWSRVPDDPIFQLTFPQPGMLDPADLARMLDLLRAGAPREALRAAARSIHERLNPHPAGQRQLNVPRLDEVPAIGLQHKYRETVLFFPRAGQTCHAYCTYCFRWPLFVGHDDLALAAQEASILPRYLRRHPEVRSVLLTGGDPLIMRSAVLRRLIEPLLAPELAHVTSIRIGSKSPAYWPHRFVHDRDADDLLRLFEEIQAAGTSRSWLTTVTRASSRPPSPRRPSEGSVARGRSSAARRP